MNRFHTYNRCDKNVKVLCVIQYKFSVLLNLPLASINTNYTLLTTSSSTSVTGTEIANDTNVKAAIETDATSGKKKFYKNLIYKEFTFTYASAYIEKMERNVKEYSSHILRYMNIY